MRYLIPFSLQSLLVRPVFRNPKSKKHEGKFGVRKVYTWRKMIRTGNT